AVRPIVALLAIERVRVTSASRSAYSSMYPLVVLVAVGLTVALILVLWTAFFPLYNFVWGDYEQHFKRRQAIGRFVLGVVLPGAAAPIKITCRNAAPSGQPG